MKRFISLATCGLILAIFPKVNHAQDMYGMASESGKYGFGTIYKVDSAGKNYTAVYHFKSENKGSTPYFSNPCELNGKIYGTTYSGGNSFGRGTIYEFDPATGKHTFLQAFNFGNGSQPYSDPIVSKSGKIYGLTSSGGNRNRGALYEFNPSNNQIILKASMYDLPNAARWPQGQLTEVGTDVFYGTTTQGGDSSKGVIFKYDLAKDSLMVVHHFASSNNGSINPCRKLMLASNGKIYGVTFNGGTNNHGTLFELDTTNFQFTTLFDFGAGSGMAYPGGGLVQHTNGKLYGTTQSAAGGYIFEYDIANDTLMKKIGFGNAAGTKPSGLLHLASNGKLYGTTTRAGQSNHGSLFEYDPLTNNVNIMHHFDGLDGNSAYGTPIMASNGRLYGASRGGGTSGQGTFYQYKFGKGGGFTSMFYFNDIQNGGWPTSGLCQANNKLLYGMTPQGGEFGKGVLFSFDPRDSTFTKLHDFIDSTGSRPHGSVIQGRDGNLYGMTREGGSSTGGSGTLFKYDLQAGKYNKLVAIDYSSSGARPEGELLEGENGKFYGMVGTINKNTLFEYTLGEDTLKTLHSFISSTGRYTHGSVIKVKNGKLYGLTRRGGANDQGVLFEFDLSNGQYKNLKDFDISTTGGYPYGTLLEAKNGLLYGTTSSGGPNNRGTFFSYDISDDTLRVIPADPNALQYAYSNVIQAINGNLYGYSDRGIFEYNETTDSVVISAYSSTTHGRNQTYGSLVQYFENGAPCVLDTTVTQTGATLSSNETGASYQWINCSDNSAISGATSQSFSPSQNGEYAVVLSNATCSDTSRCYRVSGLGIKESEIANNIRLYPNPASNTVEVVSLEEIEEIVVYSVSGEELLQSYSTLLDVSHLESGIYFIHIRTENSNKNIFKRLIKN
jgi:uncharacterized repeat protein (TIGR03803 family)